MDEYLGLTGLFVKKPFRRGISGNRLQREQMQYSDTMAAEE